MTRGEGTLRTVGVRVDNPSVICLVGDRRMTPPLAQGRLTGRGSGGRRATEGRPYEGRGGEPLPSSGVLGGQPIRVKVWFAERSGDRSLRAGFAGGRKGRPYGGGRTWTRDVAEQAELGASHASRASGCSALRGAGEGWRDPLRGDLIRLLRRHLPRARGRLRGGGSGGRRATEGRPYEGTGRKRAYLLVPACSSRRCSRL